MAAGANGHDILDYNIQNIFRKMEMDGIRWALNCTFSTEFGHVYTRDAYGYKITLRGLVPKYRIDDGMTL